ncbi:MAG: hypothetical protein ACK52I_11085, partial [Pseudomonadota bacterium]
MDIVARPLELRAASHSREATGVSRVAIVAGQAADCATRRGAARLPEARMTARETRGAAPPLAAALRSAALALGALAGGVAAAASP